MSEQRWREFLAAEGVDPRRGKLPLTAFKNVTLLCPLP
jgi:hypothetical protein